MAVTNAMSIVLVLACATASIVGDVIYLRGRRFLYAIETPRKK